VSALVNPSWLLCAALALCLAARDPRRSLRAGLGAVLATPVLVVLASSAAANVGARAMLGHAVPGDFVQEVIAARALQAGETLYPADVNPAARAWLAEDPPVLPRWLPSRAGRWLSRRQAQGRNSLAAQAHPPTLLVASAPAVLTMGPHGAYWGLTLLSLVVAAGLLVRELAPRAPARAGVLAVLVLVSWQPFLAAVRDGQPSVLVGSLLVVAWANLRRGRDLRGGDGRRSRGCTEAVPRAAPDHAGGAAPARLRRRPAGRRRGGPGRDRCSGARRVGGVRGVRASDRGIVRPHALQPVTGCALSGIVPPVLLHTTFLLSAILALEVTLGIDTGARARHGRDTFDREFASFVTLALLLSPVGWHHYVFMLVLPLALAAMHVAAAAARSSGRRMRAGAPPLPARRRVAGTVGGRCPCRRRRGRRESVSCCSGRTSCGGLRRAGPPRARRWRLEQAGWMMR
jgi:hypothetical protein